MSQNDAIFLKRLYLYLLFSSSAYQHLPDVFRLEVKLAPEKPININMNVKIEHEINVKIDRQVEDLLKTIVLYSNAGVNNEL